MAPPARLSALDPPVKLLEVEIIEPYSLNPSQSIFLNVNFSLLNCICTRALRISGLRYVALVLTSWDDALFLNRSITLYLQNVVVVPLTSAFSSGKE